MGVGGTTILLADDAPEIRESAANYILRPAGFNVLLAEDGLAALKLAKENHPDLIIADLRMPGLNGLDLRRTLASAGDNTPFILITAEGSSAVAKEAIEAGVAAYLTKPFDGDALLVAAAQALFADAARRDRLKTVRTLERRVQQLESLQSIGRVLTSSLELDEVLSRVVDAAVTMTNAEEGSLLLLDEQNGDLTMRAARNFDDQFVRTFRLRSEDSLAGQVIRTGKPVLIGADAPQKIKTSYLVHSLIYVPLRWHDKVMGVLGVDNRQSGRTFSESDIAPLAALADYAAVAIENAQLYANTNAERIKLNTILQRTEDGVIVVDENSRLILINPVAREAFNLDSTVVEGQPIADVVTNAEIGALIKRPSISNAQARHAEVTLEDGRVLNAHLTHIEGVGRAVVLQDITHLKQLDKIKSEFVTAVSHDLRSPLTAILGYVELISRVGPVNEQQAEFIRRARISVNAITSLISDLLDLGRIEAGFDTLKEPTNLSMVVRYTVDGLSGKAEAKQQKLVTNLPDNLTAVLGNPVRLRQMASNLIDNAIKYTPPGGTIKVTVEEDGDQEIFTVTDSGIGILVSDQPYIFDKFYRSQSLPEDTVGSGLGLSIVKSIVENHGGRIWVESKQGHGTRFTVVLPKITDDLSAN